MSSTNSKKYAQQNTSHKSDNSLNNDGLFEDLMSMHKRYDKYEGEDEDKQEKD